MKLDNLHKAPIEMDMETSTTLKPLSKKQQYINKDISMNTTSPSRPTPSAGGPYQGGHYDAYIEGKPRYKKYFGGSFMKAI